MRVFFLIILSSALLFSCSEKQATEEVSAVKVESKEENIIPVGPTDTIDYNFVWINKTYLSQLKKTGAHGKLWNKFKTFAIGLAPNETDLLLLNDENAGFGYFQQVKDQKLYLIPDSEENKTLEVKWLKKGQSFIINIDTLEKTSLTDPNYIVHNLLYKGEYLFNGKTVTFDGEGRIKNLDNFNSYRPEYGEENLDQENIIDLYVDSLHVAEFRADTLNLYKFICEERHNDTRSIACKKGHKGKLKYKLIRKK